MTPDGHATPEPDIGVGISLASNLQNHDEGGTGYARRELLLADFFNEQFTGTSKLFSFANVA